jgi:hypothetical protein
MEGMEAGILPQAISSATRQSDAATLRAPTEADALSDPTEVPQRLQSMQPTRRLYGQPKPTSKGRKAVRPPASGS